MLKTRVITAVVLLAILLPVLFLRDLVAFGLVVLAFFGAAVWEAFRLLQPDSKMPRLIPAIWTLAFATTVLGATVAFQANGWFVVSAGAWALCFVPCMVRGLPDLASKQKNVFYSLLYMLSLVAAFMAIVVLYAHSAVYLLSVMALVWIADIGAYFSGKAFGKRKLAPSISPGKSWEGAIGGGIAVLAIAGGSVFAVNAMPFLADTFTVQLQAKFGWAVTVGVLLLLTAASIVGDLVESQLKRRAEVKDSSNLLPGHGGVLDRIDALIPVLPLAALIGAGL